MTTQSIAVPNRSVASLDPMALAIAFGVAGLAISLLSSVAMGASFAMMGGSFSEGSAMGGWTHGASGVHGSAGAMMGGGFGFVAYASGLGFALGALAGGISAGVYNNLVARVR